MTETLTLTAEQAFKSKKNFEDYLQNNDKEFVDDLIKDYPHNNVVTIITDLTQNSATLLNAICEFGDLKPYIVWIVANEKEDLVQCARYLNGQFIKGCGIFILKAFLNDNKLAFKTLVQPNINTKNKSGTDTKQLQLNYWTKYFEICDKLECDLQIKPAAQHWQYIPIGKAGVSIQLTINTQQNYVGCELLINNNKEIFYSLSEAKDKIEKHLGELDWQELQGKKSSRIRKVYSVDITDEGNWESAIKEQIRMAEDFKTTFIKYL